MANTYVKIASVTVGSGGASTIDFSSIPATYTDLKVVLSARTTSAGGYSSDIAVTFNGSTSSYSSILLYGTGSGVGSASNSGSSLVWGAVADGNLSTSSTFGNSEMYIPNYASSNFKSASSDGVAENNGTQAANNMSANLWSNTAAINQITFTPDSGSFVQYSSATLYGIKNS